MRLRSLIMTGLDDLHRDLAGLVVPSAGFLQATGGLWDPYRLVDPSGEVVGPVAIYLSDLQAAGRAAATQRSYGMDLLRWFRFCWATGVPWDQATRCEARDFCWWIQIAAKPARPHWRAGRGEAAGEAAADVAVSPPGPGMANPVTGKLAPGGRYAASTAAHCESVLRQFYDFHLETGSGPMVNPFPLARGRRGGRAGAHHSPMDAHRDERSGCSGPGWSSGFREASPMRSSASCSPGSLAIATGHWCSATGWLGTSASRWVGMTGDGKGPADGVGGAWWCSGCRGGDRVVVVSRVY